MTTTRDVVDEAIDAPALALEHVTAGYSAGTAVLNDVSLTVPRGQVVALLGPNGAGKSTLLRCASGLLRPSAGHVRLDGQDVTAMRVDQRARHGLCDIPEGRGIFPSLSVRENLVLNCPRGQERLGLDLATQAFPILGSRMRQLAGTLSGGEQQMLALTRAYVSSPRVVMVDELSMGLAPVIVDQLFEFLVGMIAGGTALLVVEQYVAKALQLAGHVYILNRGQLIFSGRSDEISSEEVFEHYLNIGVGSHHA